MAREDIEIAVVRLYVNPKMRHCLGAVDQNLGAVAMSRGDHFLHGSHGSQRI